MARSHAAHFLPGSDGTPPRRATIVVALLVAAVALTGFLAYQAYAAARSQRRTAETVLHEYVAFAGWEFSRAASRELESTLQSSLGGIERAFTRDRSLPVPPRDGGAPSGDCECRPIPARMYFRARLGTPTDPDGETVTTSGDRPSPAFQEWLQGLAQQPGQKPHGLRLLVTTIDGNSRLVGTIVGHDGRGQHALLGFVADAAALSPLLERILKQHPLLPPSLMAERRSDAILSARVTDPSGGILFVSSAAAMSDYRSTGTLPPSLGGLGYEIALQPSAADTLLIGGLPRSRLPLLIGLFGLTTGLVLVALLQLRREYELTRLRGDFVSGVSHELRTPLAKIRMFSETMLLGRVRSDGEARRSLEIINQEAQRLGHLVENVLYFARGERGGARVALERRWLAPMLLDIVEAFTPLARTRRAKVVVSATSDVAADIDPAAFRQVLVNLLDNAAKYGPIGQTIVVSLLEEPGLARVTVDDEGPGVAAADRARIWQPFARADRREHAAVAGTGIGLAVVQEVARLHAWRVSVDAAPGGGARFIVDVPIVAERTVADSLAPSSRSRAPA